MLPSPESIKLAARQYGFHERREEASSTLFFKDITSEHHEPTLINVFYTTGGVMTKFSHPTRGYNQLWRSDAYDSLVSLMEIFANPRVHTGKGYRTANNAVRGCAKCGSQKNRGEFSKNQWRKGSGESKCTACIQSGTSNTNEFESVESVSTHARTSLSSDDIHWESIIDSITCDAEGCNKTSPSVRCTQCCMVYYCSNNCKHQHQSLHMHECIDLEHFKSMAMGTDPNSNSGLCNASSSSLSHRRSYAMVTQLSGKRSAKALLAQAEAIHQADKHWETAIELYKGILMESNDSDHNQVANPSEWRQVWMGLSRCFYELGVYDKAVNAAEAAIEMNRHFPQCHKYMALSYKAMGRRDLAIKTMKQAVLYEAPWSEVTVDANKDLLVNI